MSKFALTELHRDILATIRSRGGEATARAIMTEAQLAQKFRDDPPVGLPDSYLRHLAATSTEREKARGQPKTEGPDRPPAAAVLSAAELTEGQAQAAAARSRAVLGAYRAARAGPDKAADG